jgi:hypothetical protein
MSFWYILLQFGTFLVIWHFSALACCSKKNLATLASGCTKLRKPRQRDALKRINGICEINHILTWVILFYLKLYLNINVLKQF